MQAEVQEAAPWAPCHHDLQTQDPWPHPLLDTSSPVVAARRKWAEPWHPLEPGQEEEKHLPAEEEDMHLQAEEEDMHLPAEEEDNLQVERQDSHSLEALGSLHLDPGDKHPPEGEEDRLHLDKRHFEAEDKHHLVVDIHQVQVQLGEGIQEYFDIPEQPS